METVWRIKNMTRYQNTGLVEYVDFTFTSTLDGHTHEEFSSVRLSGNENSEGFIAYEDLTEEIALQWVMDVLGDVGITNLENMNRGILNDMIDIAVNPKKGGLPW
tara:strand:+ start:5776 stop:6090 length:315 start_codon:yes stop_codon:yes gene_type:complete